ncbi:DUF559 domain-containing protein [Planotetraspora thailandica]|nr:DUF559 domain-containing protein [Planotetraspora thailandica]
MPETSTADVVAAVLSELEAAAVALYPAWLPEADGITPGGAGAGAVRAIALQAASATGHFGPFLADLAQRSLTGASSGPAKFSPEVRAAGLARVLAAAYGRTRVAVLVDVPEGLTPAGEQVLVSAFEWLAHHAGLGIWFAGAPLAAADRLEAVTVQLEAVTVPLPGAGPAPLPVRQAEQTPAVRFPAPAGRPHPASTIERRLEKALAACEWAHGREWNHPYQSHALANRILLDLCWLPERCVVEIDGPEHRDPARFEADRRRDVQLQLDGFAVLRFTNDQVSSDVEAVVRQIERFVTGRRNGTFEGTPHD